MPAKGKHRRPKSGPISRGVLAAGTGGAALALPLIGATAANAADQAAPAAKPAAASVAAAHTAPTAAPAKAAPKTYSVVSGDYLSKIAAEHKIKGGWEKLYQDNRSTVGGDPSLIHPGMKLTLGAKGSAPAEESAAPEAAPKKAAPTEGRAEAGAQGRHDLRRRLRGLGQVRADRLLRGHRLRLVRSAGQPQRHHPVPRFGRQLVQRLPHRLGLPGRIRHPPSWPSARAPWSR